MGVNPVDVIAGSSAIILGQPHGGTFVPHDVQSALNENGLKLADTDWHIGRLYDGLLASATVVRANFHRYVIDANRDPSGQSLYPGQNTTGLCPVTDFDGLSVYREGHTPSAAEIITRTSQWHAPYHAALHKEIERAKKQHGVAIVFDCHSIRSRIPFLFEGELPALNIGTDNGRTCSPHVSACVVRVATGSPFSHVLNGRFRGGWTTRHYGQPGTGVHAIQLEIAQSAYLTHEAPPWAYDGPKADMLREHLRAMLHGLDALARSGNLSH